MITSLLPCKKLYKYNFYLLVNFFTTTAHPIKQVLTMSFLSKRI